MQSVEEILYLHEDDVVEMKQGGRVGFEPGGPVYGPGSTQQLRKISTASDRALAESLLGERLMGFQPELPSDQLRNFLKKIIT